MPPRSLTRVNILGGASCTSLPYNFDFNNAERGVLYRCTTSALGTATNQPTGAGYGLLETHISGEGIGYQKYYVLYKTWIRNYVNGTWSPWRVVYDDAMLTDSSLLSPLASALGASYTSVTVQGNGSAILSILTEYAGVFDLKCDGSRYCILTYFVSTEGVATVGAVTTERYSSVFDFEGNSNRQLILKNLSNSAKTFYYRKL